MDLCIDVMIVVGSATTAQSVNSPRPSAKQETPFLLWFVCLMFFSKTAHRIEVLHEMSLIGILAGCAVLAKHDHSAGFKDYLRISTQIRMGMFESHMSDDEEKREPHFIFLLHPPVLPTDDTSLGAELLSYYYNSNTKQPKHSCTVETLCCLRPHIPEERGDRRRSPACSTRQYPLHPTQQS